jgi:hypothetical protein
MKKSELKQIIRECIQESHRGPVKVNPGYVFDHDYKIEIEVDGQFKTVIVNAKGRMSHEDRTCDIEKADYDKEDLTPDEISAVEATIEYYINDWSADMYDKYGEEDDADDDYDDIREHYEEAPRDKEGRVSLEDISYDMEKSRGEITKIIATLRGKQSEVFTKLADRLLKIDQAKADLIALNEEVKQEAGREKIAALFGAEYEFVTREIRTVNAVKICLSKQPKEAETTKWAQVYEELSAQLTPQLVLIAESIVKKFTTIQSPKPPYLYLPKEPSVTTEGIISSVWSQFINKLKLWGKMFDKKLINIETMISRG